MGFSRGQQGIYRPLVAAAWKLHSDRAGIDAKDKPARKTWYETELREATGNASTTACNKGRDFDRARAHFEALAEAGIEGQLAEINGITKRLRWNAGQANPNWLDRFADDAAFVRYMRAIAAQITGRELPELHNLDDREILTLTRAVVNAAKRELTSGETVSD